ncbi:hypothetical protein INS49_014791 [Diaporthe citri]|uniref:uncharacterized protein n=1 Tax=Diaporthe citri TaxID=83186 RepID=UPI001C827A72|nr:uncharacterized protein INS49_014791 [Diaporthe citri]KAG6356916.1 hypothetical protein INS49_014791 [Diaporthe citri]
MSVDASFFRSTVKDRCIYDGASMQAGNNTMSGNLCAYVEGETRVWACSASDSVQPVAPTSAAERALSSATVANDCFGGGIYSHWVLIIRTHSHRIPHGLGFFGGRIYSY